MIKSVLTILLSGNLISKEFFQFFLKAGVSLKKNLICAMLATFLISSHSALAKERLKLCPIGEAVGICLESDGLLVVSTDTLEDENGNKINAAENSDIRAGDRIISADGIIVSKTTQLSDYLQTRKGDISLTLKRNSRIFSTSITPVKTADGTKLGLWLKDSTAGIGTITYANPKNGSFGALGHEISDNDTNKIFPTCGGNIFKCTLSPPTIGKKGTPGALNGIFGNNALGTVEKNSPCGIYGKLTFDANLANREMKEIGFADEIRSGNALILSDIDGLGAKPYKIEIKKINPSSSNGKNISFKVTDPVLIEKTGGIVQGMSGSPIIQDDKIIGAVTHVCVNL